MDEEKKEGEVAGEEAEEATPANDEGNKKEATV